MTHDNIKTTPKSKIHFMAIAKPLAYKNKETGVIGTPQYSIAVELDLDSDVVKMIKATKRDVLPKRVLLMHADGTLDKTKTIINFSSQFPLESNGKSDVRDANNSPITAPFFDGRVDTGEAVVVFEIKDNKYVNLKGVQLFNLVITEKEGQSNVMDTAIKSTSEILKDIDGLGE